MKDLFSPDGLRLLESFCYANTLFAFDFDGTLAPIVADPEAAACRPCVREALDRLAQLAPVAILSGRGLRDLRPRLPDSIRHVAGNHGLEGLGISARDAERARRQARGWLREIGEWRGPPGLEVEDKAYSVSLHYRHAKSRREAKTRIERKVLELSPAPRIIPGKCVVNLLPEGAPHKGIALMNAMERTRTRAAIYVGDDDTDEDVFRLPAPPRVLSIRVGKKATSGARFYLAKQGQILALIREVIRHVEARGARP